MAAAIFELRDRAAGAVERGRQTNPRYDPAAARAHKCRAAGENASDHHCGRHDFFGVAALFGCVVHVKERDAGLIAGDTTSSGDDGHTGRQLVRSFPYIESARVRLGFIVAPYVLDKDLVWETLVPARPVRAEAVKNVDAVQRILHDSGRSAGAKHGSAQYDRLAAALRKKLIHNQLQLRMIRF